MSLRLQVLLDIWPDHQEAVVHTDSEIPWLRIDQDLSFTTALLRATQFLFQRVNSSLVAVQ